MRIRACKILPKYKYVYVLIENEYVDYEIDRDNIIDVYDSNTKALKAKLKDKEDEFGIQHTYRVERRVLK